MLFAKTIDKLVRRMGYTKRSTTFDGALQTRLTSDWLTSTYSADSKIRNSLNALRARSRDLRDNNDYAAKFACMLKTNVVGDKGIHLKMKVKDPDTTVGGQLVPGRPDDYVNRTIEMAWANWAKPQNCSMSGALSLASIQNICIESTAIDGEILVRKYRDGNKLRVQLIESDYLDHELNTKLKDGASIRMGVEMDSFKRPTFYHLWDGNPNDPYYYQSPNGHRRIRIPAAQIIHLFIRRRPDQSRGYPWLTSAMTRMNMLGGYEEAELTASRVAACKMGFFKTKGDTAYRGPDDGAGNKLMDAEPGSFEDIGDLELQTFDPQHPNSQYGMFMKTALRGIAAGLGVSYHSLANDFESVNFSSGRLGSGEEREYWKALQCWLIEQLLKPLFEEWLELELASGRIALPMSKFDKFNQPNFRGRRWAYINPIQEVNANIEAIKHGLTSRTRVLAEQGLELHEVLEEIKAEEDMADKLDINIGVVPTETEAPEPMEATA